MDNGIMTWKQATHKTSRTNPEPCGDFTYTYYVAGDVPEPRIRPEPQPGTIVRLDGETSWVDVVRVSDDLILVGDHTSLSEAYEQAVIDDTHVLIRKHVGPMRWMPKSQVIDCDYNADGGRYLGIMDQQEMT